MRVRQRVRGVREGGGEEGEMEGRGVMKGREGVASLPDGFSSSPTFLDINCFLLPVFLFSLFLF